VAFGGRFDADEASAILASAPQLKRYAYEAACGYYETLPLYAMNRFVEEETGSLVHLDVSNGRYRVMKIIAEGAAG
jgi:hypothetical protein